MFKPYLGMQLPPTTKYLPFGHSTQNQVHAYSFSKWNFYFLLKYGLGSSSVGLQMCRNVPQDQFKTECYWSKFSFLNNEKLIFSIKSRDKKIHSKYYLILTKDFGIEIYMMWCQLVWTRMMLSEQLKCGAKGLEIQNIKNLV